MITALQHNLWQKANASTVETPPKFYYTLHHIVRVGLISLVGVIYHERAIWELGKCHETFSGVGIRMFLLPYKRGCNGEQNNLKGKESF